MQDMINNLSIAEKIELYNCLYEDLAGKGIDGDTQLAHVNVEEMAVLRAMGGSGTINPHTNLIQFGGGGAPSPPPAPAQQTVTQQATIPDELKPFVTDVLEKAQAIQERREEEGYVPFSGPRIAEFSPEQTQAFEQIKGLVGTGQQYFDPAARLTASSAFAPTGPQVGQFMNPYIQNVVDIQQREARRAGDIERQRLGAQAVGAGAFGGSRQAILEAEQSRNLQQQLGDIQARGLAAAYEDAQTRLQQQRERERLAGAQFASLGQAAPGQAFRELSALEAIGAQRQQQAQQALDIAQQEYEIARTFPERTLQDYQSIIRGYAAPIPASTVQRSQVTRPAPSFLQQAAGLGGLAIGAGQAFSGFKKEGGLVGLANGGSLNPVERRRRARMQNTLGINAAEQGVPEKEENEENELTSVEKRKNARANLLQKDVDKTSKNINEGTTKISDSQKKLADALRLNAASNQANNKLETNYLEAITKLGQARTAETESKRKILEEQQKNLGYGPEDFAAGLLRFAAADTEKATTQQLAEAFSDLPEKNKQAIADQRAIELAQAGLDTEEAKSQAETEKDLITLQLAIKKAEQGAKLDIKEAEAISNLALNDPDILPQLLPSVDKASQRLILQMLASKKGETTRVNQPKPKPMLTMKPRTAASEGTK